MYTSQLYTIPEVAQMILSFVTQSIQTYNKRKAQLFQLVLVRYGILLSCHLKDLPMLGTTNFFHRTAIFVVDHRLLRVGM